MTIVYRTDHEHCDEALVAAKKETKKWRMLARDAAALLGEQLDEGEWSHAHCNEDAGGNHTLDQKWWESDAKAFIAKIDELTA